MEQRRIARKHPYAGGSCWPSNFGLVTSEPLLWSVFLCSSTMECPGRLSVTRQGARFLKRNAFVPARALKWQGCFDFLNYSWTWTFQTVLFTTACIVFTLYFYTKPSTNTALYFESGSSWQICRDHLVTNRTRNTCKRILYLPACDLLSWVFLFFWELMASKTRFLNTRGRRTVSL